MTLQSVDGQATGWGAYVQSGLMLSARAELTARYSHLVPLRGADATFLAADEVGAGLSYYLRGHDLKVQGDWFRVTDPLLGRWAQQVRLQFQLFF